MKHREVLVEREVGLFERPRGVVNFLIFFGVRTFWNELMN